MFGIRKTVGKDRRACLMKHDVVYILKNNMESDEIIYSLRSVEKNFPYRKIWFVGGCPGNIAPDVWMNFIQQGDTKWQKATSAIAAACKNDEITEDFWLFNDDFFVMKRIRVLKPMIRGTLKQRCKDIEEPRNGIQTPYSRMLRRTQHVLKINGYPQLDYALHVPMLINRKKALEVLEAFPNCPMFRSLYGNYCGIEAEKVADVKVRTNGDFPKDTRLLSTDDSSFYHGEVGKYIREMFPEPSKYEV